MKRKLWNRDFALLFQGKAVSTIGDLMYSVAIGYWVYEQTGSSGLMGVMSSISLLATMFLSPFCGSIVDKCNRKWIIVAIDLMQGLLMLAAGILAYRDVLSVPVVLITATLAAFGSVFYSPAVDTIMIDIIPHDDMVRGRSVFSGMGSLIDTLGSAFSGVMVAFFGVPLIVVINGLSNLYSAFSEMFISVPRTVQQGEKVTVKVILSDFRTALKVIFTDKCLQIFVPCGLLLNLLGAGPFALILPFCMEKGFTVEMYGYLMSAYTAAALICVTIIGIVKLSPKMRYWTMAVGFCVSTVCMIMAFMSVQFSFMCGWAIVGSFLNSAGNAIFSASMMLALPDANRGTILGVVKSSFTGGSALSVLAFGFLGDVFPLYIVFAVGSALALAPMLFLCLRRATREFILNN